MFLDVRRCGMEIRLFPGLIESPWEVASASDRRMAFNIHCPNRKSHPSAAPILDSTAL